MFQWNGYLPAPGQIWQYSKRRLDELASDGRIIRLGSGAPTLKRFYKEETERALRELSDANPEIAAANVSVELLIRDAMRNVASRIANSPAELCALEWRDLERLLFEVF